MQNALRAVLITHDELLAAFRLLVSSVPNVGNFVRVCHATAIETVLEELGSRAFYSNLFEAKNNQLQLSLPNCAFSDGTVVHLVMVQYTTIGEKVGVRLDAMDLRFENATVIARTLVKKTL